MMKNKSLTFRIIFFSLIFNSLGACAFLNSIGIGSEAQPIEVWNDTISSQTTKIKITSNLSGAAFKDECRAKVVQYRMLLDVENSSSSRWITSPLGHPLGKMIFDFQGNSLTLSVEYEKTGLNGPYWETLSYDDHPCWIRANSFSESMKTNSIVKYNSFILP